MALRGATFYDEFPSTFGKQPSFIFTLFQRDNNNQILTTSFDTSILLMRNYVISKSSWFLQIWIDEMTDIVFLKRG